MGFSILLETLMMKQHTSLSQQSMHELMKEALRLTQHENTTHTHSPPCISFPNLLDKLIVTPVRSLAAVPGKRLLNDRYGYNVTAGTDNPHFVCVRACVCVCGHVEKKKRRRAVM